MLTLLAFTLNATGCDDDDTETIPAPDPEPEIELTIDLAVKDITAEDAVFSATPSVKEASYYVSVVEKATFDAAGADQFLNDILSQVKNSDLVKGDHSEKVTALTPETEYTLFAVGVNNGTATSKLVSKNFTTLKKETEPEPEKPAGPQITMTSGVGDENGNGKDAIVWITVKSDSHDVTKANILLAFTEMVDSALADGQNLEQIVLGNDNFACGPEHLELLNLQNPEAPLGLELLLNAANPDTAYTAVCYAANEQGVTICRNDIHTEKAVSTPLQDGIVNHTNSAQFQEYIFDQKTEGDWVFKGDRPFVIDFYADWCGPCKQMEPTMEKMAAKYSGQISFCSINVDLEVKLFAYFANRYNKEGGLPFLLFIKESGEIIPAVGYQSEYKVQELIDLMLDVTPEKPDPEVDPLPEGPIDPDAFPVIEAEAGIGDADGNRKDNYVWVNIKCTTRNATEGAIWVDYKGDVAYWEEKGYTLEEAVDQNPREMQHFNEMWLKDLNLLNPEHPHGVTLNVSDTSDDLLFTFLIDVRNRNNDRCVKKVQAKTERRPTRMPYMNDQMFCEKIWDYKSNPEWNFVNTKPTVLFFFDRQNDICRVQFPLIDALSIEFEGQVEFYAIDVNESPETFEVMAKVGNNPRHDLPFFAFIDPVNAWRPYYLMNFMEEDRLRNYIGKILPKE